MCSKVLAVLSAVAVLGVSSTAMAKGGGGSHGGMFMHGHGHFDHRFARRLFNRGLFNNINGWGWGGDWGWGGYGDNGNRQHYGRSFSASKAAVPAGKAPGSRRDGLDCC
jgi:hypothetical protein